MVFSYFTQCLLKFAYLSQFHNLITGNAVKSVTTHLFFLVKVVKNAVHSLDQSLKRKITKKNKAAVQPISLSL